MQAIPDAKNKQDFSLVPLGEFPHPLCVNFNT